MESESQLFAHSILWLELSLGRDEFSLHTNKLFFMIISVLSFNLCLILLNGLLILGFQTENLHLFLISPVRATFPTDLIVLHVIAIMWGWKYEQNMMS
jgi:hypothetical protein